MQARLGHDLGHVRIHSGVDASSSAGALGAAAFTVGSDIVFGAGRFTPNTTAGRELLAHELAHVVQQRDAAVGQTLGPADPRAEGEARAVARAVALGGPAPAVTPQRIASLARQDAGVSPSGGSGGGQAAHPSKPASKSLVFAQSLATKYPGWRGVLPNCPCTDAEARSSPDWAGPNACLPAYHPGAASGYRSSRGYASIPGTSHGQQCCYGPSGMLITEGQAAGTPDLVHAPSGFWGAVGGIFTSGPGPLSAAAHYENDVRTFNDLGWQVYNRYWVPNNGNGCPANKKP